MNKDITTCMGYQQITLGAASTALTIPSVDPNTGLAAMPTHAVIIVDAVSVRWRDDGVDPTPAIGMPLLPGTVFIYDGDLRKLRFIRTAVGSILNVSYYK
jgi:hypothetical protein